MNGLSFTVGSELYTVDVNLVQKVARKLMITPVPSAPSEIVGIANLKGRVVTVLNLCRLLGIDKTDEAARYIHTVVFKSFSSSEDQMGLAIEKPGNLIEIDDADIKPSPLTAGSEGSFCISGVAETNDMFYRIIDIESIWKKYTHSTDLLSEITSENPSSGGHNNEQHI